MSNGMISEYYDIVRDALRIELKREPSHTEIMDVVMGIVNKHLEKK